MIVRSKAPLRLGLAGGGTDVSPYSDLYGGAILNATINLYAYVVICPRDDGKIVLEAIDMNEKEETRSEDALKLGGRLDLLKGVYNRIVRDFVKKPLSFQMSTYVDAPPGSGLGTSSTLTVAIVGAFREWLRLPLGEYDIAHLAYEIERKDVALAGGKQDQYAAAFGGFNFMEFYANDKVIVNPLRIRQEYINELEFNIVIYYTGVSRDSANIIDEQSRNITSKKDMSLRATDMLKEQAVAMKEAILKGELTRIGDILDFGWKYKKGMAQKITNPLIDEIYDAGKKAGASGGKISGAGGGGFMMFFCPDNTRFQVIQKLAQFGGETKRFQFTEQGLLTWQQRG